VFNLKGLAPSYLSNRFSYRSETHDRNTRRKDELDVPLYRAAVGKRSFLYRETKFTEGHKRNLQSGNIKKFNQTVFI
jgi:hypothetical protein